MIKIKQLLNEGILDGVSASFIVDSGMNESSVKSGKKSMMLPRYSVWGFTSTGNGTPKIMENGNDLPTLLDKHGINEEDVYPIEGTMQETIRKVGTDKWAVFPKKGGKRLGTHDSKQSAENQLAAIHANEDKKKNVKKSLRG